MKDFNFFAVYEKKKFAIDPKSPSFIIYAAITISILACSAVYFTNFIYSQKLEDINTALEQKSNDTDYLEVNKLQIHLAALEEYDNMTNEVINKYDQANIIKSKFFTDFAKIIPQKVKLENINITGTVVTLNCISGDKKIIAELISDMDESDIFESTALKSVTASKEKDAGATNYSAIIEAIVKAGVTE